MRGSSLESAERRHDIFQAAIYPLAGSSTAALLVYYKYVNRDFSLLRRTNVSPNDTRSSVYISRLAQRRDPVFRLPIVSRSRSFQRFSLRWLYFHSISRRDVERSGVLHGSPIQSANGTTEPGTRGADFCPIELFRMHCPTRSLVLFCEAGYSLLQIRTR